MAMSRPRISRISSSVSWSRSSLRKRTWPDTIFPGSGTRRRIDRAVIDLPLPDSPTMPRVSPGYRSKVTPSTARTMPSWVSNWVRRSRTCRIGAATLAARARVQRVAEPVTQEVERHQRQRQRDRRRDDHVRREADGIDAVFRHRAPRRRRLLDARAQKAQEGLEQDRRGNAEGGLDDDW